MVPEVSDPPTPIEALPSPEEMRATYERMRDSVLAAHDTANMRVAEARDLLSDALAEAREIRESYPELFPEEPPAVKERGKVSVEQMNTALRSIAEHPGESYKQIGRRIGYSESWVSEIVRATNENGGLIQRAKRGRTFVHSLTEEGRRVVDTGGIRA